MIEKLRKSIKIAAALALCMCILMCSCACSRAREYYLLDDYGEYLLTLVQYYRVEEDGGDTDKDDTDEGDTDEGDTDGGDPDEGEEGEVTPGPPEELPFVPEPADDIADLEKVYGDKLDYATEFFGSYAYVLQNNTAYLMDKNGNLTEIPENSDENHSTMSDITIEKMSCDKLIVGTKAGKKGVLDIYGKVIAEIVYDEIQVSERLIVARKGEYNKVGDYDIFIDGVKTHSATAETISLISDDFLSRDGVIVRAGDMAAAKIAGYRMKFAPTDGVACIVTDDNKSVGYASYPSGEILIEPKYRDGSAMFGGVAVVRMLALAGRDKIFDYPMLIDSRGEVIFDFETLYGDDDYILPGDIHVMDNHGGYNMFDATSTIGSSTYGVVKYGDGGPEVTPLRFPFREPCLYGDYYIVGGTNQLCSVSTGGLVREDVQVVSAVRGKFVVQNADDSYSLLDGDLSEIIGGCENIVFYDDILTVKKDGKYAIYRIPGGGEGKNAAA